MKATRELLAQFRRAFIPMLGGGHYHEAKRLADEAEAEILAAEGQSNPDLDAARDELQAAHVERDEVMRSSRPVPEDEWKEAEARVMEAQAAFTKALKRHNLVSRIESFQKEAA